MLSLLAKGTAACGVQIEKKSLMARGLLFLGVGILSARLLGFAESALAEVSAPDAAPLGAPAKPSGPAGMVDSPFYELKVTSIEGETEELSKYRGKVVLIVNTASKCGFTIQYADLQKLYDRFRERGLVVLGFPSNDFANQEPDSNKKIQEFCRVKFGVSFPMYERGHVKGGEIQPLFKLLTEKSGDDYKGEVGWNFEKFLIDRKGALRGRFGSFSNPQCQSIVAKIEELLAEEGLPRLELRKL